MAFLFVGAIAQPNWNYTNTGANHSIAIPGTIPVTIDGVQISVGDYIGVFYDSLGTLVCGSGTGVTGGAAWTGVSTFLSAWGDDSGTSAPDGFASGEAFVWKIWRASDGMVFDAVATYNTSAAPNQGNYVTNGMSVLESLTAVSSVPVTMPWSYTNTGNNHSILVQAGTPITINNVQIDTGDYVGVFYDSLGTLSCAGYYEYDGNTFALTAWGDDPGSTALDGFANNEEFKWKIWRASDGVVFNAVASYSTMPIFPNQGNFASNGMSGLTDLTAIVGSDLGIGNILNPVSGCGTLDSAETFSFQILNLGVSDVDTFMVSYSVDNGQNFYYDTIVSTLAVNGTYLYTSPYVFDFSAIASYSCILTVETSLDDTPGNDSVNVVINNFTPPNVSFVNLQPSYCTSSEAVALNADPAGGWFISGSVPIIGSNVYFVQSGNFDITYQYTDSNNCTASITQTVMVYQSPEVDLGSDQILCEGDSVLLGAGAGFIGYSWSTGDTDSSLTVFTSDTYSVTITNSDGCEAEDAVDITFYPNPVANIQGDTVGCEGETIALSVAGQGNSYTWNTGDIMDHINVSTSGTYAVTVSAQGCIGEDEIDVTFYPNPIVDLGPDVVSCQGETVVLDAGTWSSYLWSTLSTSPTIDVMTSGNYSVSVTDQNGCFGTDAVAVTFNPLPIADFTFNTVGFLVNFTNTSNFENAGSYQWTFGDGTTSTDENPQHEYTEPGDYSVQLTVSNDCGSDSITLQVMLLGIDGVNSEEAIVIYPNPSKGIVHVVNTNVEKIKQIALYNSLGSLIEVRTSNLAEWDLSGLNKGFYFMKIESSNHNSVQKIVIQ